MKARDLTLSSICSYQPSTASTAYATPNPEKLLGKTPIDRLLAQTYSFVYSSIFLFRRRPGEAITI